MKTAIPSHSPLPRGFHPYLAQWFRQHFVAPSPAQKGGWGPVMAGRDYADRRPHRIGQDLGRIPLVPEQAGAGRLEGPT